MSAFTESQDAVLDESAPDVAETREGVALPLATERIHDGNEAPEVGDLYFGIRANDAHLNELLDEGLERPVGRQVLLFAAALRLLGRFARCFALAFALAATVAVVSGLQALQLGPGLVVCLATHLFVQFFGYLSLQQTGVPSQSIGLAAILPNIFTKDCPIIILITNTHL